MIKDSGTRRDFGTGAVRDAAEGKGRMDLMPLDVIGELYPADQAEFFDWIGEFINTNEVHYLYCAFEAGAELMFGDVPTAIMEVSIHMEEGCKKYGDRNWEMGIPLHNYIDSACRHYNKWCRGDEDEPHNRAALWNIICAIWTLKHHPELNDMPNAHKNVAATEDEWGVSFEPMVATCNCPTCRDMGELGRLMAEEDEEDEDVVVSMENLLMFLSGKSDCLKVEKK